MYCGTLASVLSEAQSAIRVGVGQPVDLDLGCLNCALVLLDQTLRGLPDPRCPLSEGFLCGGFQFLGVPLQPLADGVLGGTSGPIHPSAGASPVGSCAAKGVLHASVRRRA